MAQAFHQAVLDQAGKGSGALDLVLPDQVEALAGDRAGGVPQHLQ